MDFKTVGKAWMGCKKAFVMLIIFMISSVVKVVADNRATVLLSATISDLGRIWENIIALVLLGTVIVVASYVKQCSSATAEHRVNQSMQDGYNEKVLYNDYEMFTKLTATNINSAAEFIYNIGGIGIETAQLIIDISSIGLILFEMIRVSGRELLLPIMIVYGISAVAMKYVFKKAKMYDAEINSRNRRKKQEYANMINGFAEVRSFCTQKTHIDFIHNSDEEKWVLRNKRTRLRAFANATFNVAERAGILLVIIYSAHAIDAGTMVPATAVALVMLAEKLMYPVTRMLDYLDIMAKLFEPQRHYDKFMAYENKVSPGTITLENFEKDIRLENVSFSYNRTNPILKNISMTIPRGARIGICGESGGGKSTIFKLLNKFYDVDDGKIMIDGFDLRDLTHESYRQIVGSVHQENHLFPGTIRENILYGNPGTTDTELVEACKKAHIYKFIMSQPDRFDTNVGPDGLKLSGGLKQRIALARMFLRNPPIILLDEATSALDNDSERLIQKSIDSVDRDTTIITIAHRLSTIQKCDKIYVMGNYGILEEGTHSELIAKRGAYYRMCCEGEEQE